jgi:Competence protein CoiA-like family
MGVGEPRLVMAAFKDENRRGELFVMEDGEARNLYDFTRNELHCFFGDCPQPALKAVSRAHARDGFSHMSGGQKHAPESVNHEQGKIVIRDWLRSKYPAAETALEVPIDGARTRIADVLVTGTRGGKIAFEIQYAALTLNQWQQRHEDYVKHGITDIWLFGHAGAQFKRSSAAEGKHVRLNPVQRAIARTKQPVFWFNPELGQLAIAYTIENADEGRRLPVMPRHQISLLCFLDLEEFDLVQAGLHAPFLDELIQNEESVQQFKVTWDGWKRQVDERRRKEELQQEAARRTEHQRVRASRMERQKSLARTRAARTRELVAQRERATVQAIDDAAERRIRHVARGKPVHCPRCWYPLTTMEEARKGTHSNCTEPSLQI